MEIIPVEAGPLATMCYVATDPVTGKSIVIDVPPEGAEILFSLIRQNKSELSGIILTHSHWDHSAEAGKLSEMTGAPVASHPADEYRLKNPSEHSIFHLPFKLEPVAVSKYLIHKDVISFGKEKLEIRHTPGHTEGSICLVSHTDKVVFSGDTLFKESIGRFDLPGGNQESLIDSIKQQLLSLSDNFKVLCGHGESTTIGYERLNNPFF
ncbi:MAG: beta-lactamase domain protein [Ignavibacteria bacterium]|nr:beta-lactamase domain protein [Ignavibacteria bacterium]